MDDAARVHGFVVEGSIERDLSAKVVRFRVRSTPESAGGSSEDALPVVYSSLDTPDLFKDGAEVVVEGRLGGSSLGTFEATHILAKCPSKFEAKATIFFLILAIITLIIASQEGLRILIFKKNRICKQGKTPSQAGLILGGFHVSLLISIGLIFGFGKSPYYSSSIGLILNAFLLTNFYERFLGLHGH